MPRLTQSQPKYRKHKASGQAFVELGGKRHYLGPHGTKASRTEYDRLIGEWLAAGRPSRALVVNDVSITELCRSYWQFAKQHYRKDGRPTKQLPNVRIAIRILRERYGDTNAVDFGPLAMKAIQQTLIEQGNSRKYINDHTGRIKRVFKWGAQNELIPVDAWHRVQIAPGLAKGRTEAHETEPVEPVDDAVVEATLPHVSSIVADMVRFQRLVGCRPNEVCIVRPRDIDRSGDVWVYVPEEACWLADNWEAEALKHYLGIVFGDREATRIVDGQKRVADFSKAEKQWLLFLRLVAAGERGVDTSDLNDEFGSSLYHLKSGMFDKLSNHSGCAFQTNAG